MWKKQLGDFILDQSKANDLITHHLDITIGLQLKRQSRSSKGTRVFEIPRYRIPIRPGFERRIKN